MDNETPKRNCWTCRHAGPQHDNCYLLTLDEVADTPILDWLAPVMDDGGAVDREADGCPGWLASAPTTNCIGDDVQLWSSPEWVWTVD